MPRRQLGVLCAALVWPEAAGASSCPLLEPSTAFTFHRRYSTGVWSGAVAFTRWQPGATLSLAFPADTQIRSAVHAFVVRHSPRAIVLKLDGATPQHSIVLQGTGGCWPTNADTASGLTSGCNPEVSCESAPAPAPPPISPPSPPVAVFVTTPPRLQSTTCYSAQVCVCVSGAPGP